MPRGRLGDQQGGRLTPAQAQRQILWAQTHQHHANSLANWDPKTDQLVEALLTVLATGATLVLRPGSGNRSVGVAIWEGDVRHAPEWCYEAEELDAWAEWVISKMRAEDAAD
jgi:hypothetical protein